MKGGAFFPFLCGRQLGSSEMWNEGLTLFRLHSFILCSCMSWAASKCLALLWAQRIQYWRKWTKPLPSWSSVLLWWPGSTICRNLCSFKICPQKGGQLSAIEKKICLSHSLGPFSSCLLALHLLTGLNLPLPFWSRAVWKTIRILYSELFYRRWLPVRLPTTEIYPLLDGFLEFFWKQS